MLLRRKCTRIIMCIRLIFCRRVGLYLKFKSKFSHHGQIEENPPETLVEPYGQNFEGVAGDNRIRLLRFAVSDQTMNVCSGSADRKQDGTTRDSRLTTMVIATCVLRPVQAYLLLKTGVAINWLALDLSYGSAYR